MNSSAELIGVALVDTKVIKESKSEVRPFRRCETTSKSLSGSLAAVMVLERR